MLALTRFKTAVVMCRGCGRPINVRLIPGEVAKDEPVYHASCVGKSFPTKFPVAVIILGTVRHLTS